MSQFFKVCIILNFTFNDCWVRRNLHICFFENSIGTKTHYVHVSQVDPFWCNQKGIPLRTCCALLNKIFRILRQLPSKSNVWPWSSGRLPVFRYSPSTGICRARNVVAKNWKKRYKWCVRQNLGYAFETEFDVRLRLAPWSSASSSTQFYIVL